MAIFYKDLLSKSNIYLFFTEIVLNRGRAEQPPVSLGACVGANYAGELERCL
jgi:hypothetical protein